MEGELLGLAVAERHGPRQGVEVELVERLLRHRRDVRHRHDHLAAQALGGLRPGLDALDALVGGFPAGTLSGAPQVRAREIIEELEPDRRGIYAGCIGYFAANGTMDTCIGLRTAMVKDGTMYVQAGAGIVADSVAESEFEETRQKARALVRAAEEAVRFAAGKSGGNSGD